MREDAWQTEQSRQAEALESAQRDAIAAQQDHTAAIVKQGIAADAHAKALRNATWVLAVATIILAVATVVLVIVAATAPG
jgi:t-SNARE complex subunit (syntaxin)